MKITQQEMDRVEAQFKALVEVIKPMVEQTCVLAHRLETAALVGEDEPTKEDLCNDRLIKLGVAASQIAELCGPNLFVVNYLLAMIGGYNHDDDHDYEQEPATSKPN